MRCSYRLIADGLPSQRYKNTVRYRTVIIQYVHCFGFVNAVWWSLCVGREFGGHGYRGRARFDVPARAQQAADPTVAAGRGT